jgi:hypothetical protein
MYNISHITLLDVFPRCYILYSVKPLLQKSFHLLQASVLCRQLGFIRASDTSGAPGQANATFSFSGLKCQGHEMALKDCQQGQSEECPSQQVVMVQCVDTPKGNAKLFIVLLSKNPTYTPLYPEGRKFEPRRILDATYIGDN